VKLNRHHLSTKSGTKLLWQARPRGQRTH
jgi:hypothetical protein